MPKKEKMPAPVVRRLPLYWRLLKTMQSKGEERVSSQQLAEVMDMTASQVRQDMNCFGASGKQGCGYQVKDLLETIDGIFQVRKSQDAILVGTENAVRALKDLLDFESCGFHLIGEFCFDSKDDTLPKEADMYTFCDKYHPSVAVVCTEKTETCRLVRDLAAHSVISVCNYSAEELPEDYCGLNVENVFLSEPLLRMRFRTAEKDVE